jgi:curved DNA-binding protein CbpA
MPRGAPRDEIAAAYRRLAKAIHPDLGADDKADMRDLNWAWHILSDPARRADWDAAHPSSPSHWRAARTEPASWQPAEESEVVTAAWRAAGGWTEAADLPGRQRQFGCVGLLLLAVLVAGLIFISALYPNVPDPGNQEVQASAAP